MGGLSEIFLLKGEVERGLPDWSYDDKEHLEEELSDVLLYLVQFADVCGLDLGQAALSKMHRNTLPLVLTKSLEQNYMLNVFYNLFVWFFSL